MAKKKVPEEPGIDPRRSGLDATATLPWGTHLSHFYQTRQYLIDIAVPYLEAGLEDHEYCIWVTPDGLSEKRALAALRKAIPDFSKYAQQLEIIPASEWYLKDGVFNKQKVIDASADRYNKALAKGYAGLRATGDASWLKKAGWKDFMEFEQELSNNIGVYKTLSLCTYTLQGRGAAEALSVIGKHHLTLIRQGDKWTLMGAETITRREIPSPAIAQAGITPSQELALKAGLAGLNDREIVELMLSLCCTPGERKKLAEIALSKFQNLRDFISAAPQELEQIGFSPYSIFCLNLMKGLHVEVLRRKILEQPVYSSSREIFDYLNYSMRDLKNEIFKVIYMNRRGQIINTADLFTGSVDSIMIRPRDIVETAFKHNAGALIFVHNHPSGDPSPSRSDKQLTRDLVFVGNVLQIKVLDHIIIGANSYYSFADEKLMQKYEDNFLNLKIRNLLDKHVQKWGSEKRAIALVT